jgi:hypothetical protein
MAKGYYPRGPAAASLNMTDGYVYHRINFSKTLLPPTEKIM